MDCSGLLSGVGWPRPGTVQELARACAEWGFFQAVHTGVPQELVQQHFEASARRAAPCGRVHAARVPHGNACMHARCAACVCATRCGVRQADKAVPGRFFASAADVRDSCRRSRDNAWGYADNELTKQQRDLKEVFDMGRVPNPRLPEDHPDNRQAQAARARHIAWAGRADA